MGAKREEILTQLSIQEFIDHENPSYFHGRIYKSVPPLPQVKWECSYNPRGDMDAPDWLTGTEYVDQELVFKDKIKKLARLLRLSEKTVIYSGAGISTSAGIGQAARGAGIISDVSTDAEPTLTHKAIAALKDQGLIHSWVQQNHDGLPQKAGYPQEDIFEIHGSWYDPSNPVVCYEGVMRSDLYSRMRKAADSADLVLVLGTSLSGLNSDQVVNNTARRSAEGKCLGTVIVNLQQTERDGETTLRLFSETDLVFSSLLTLLGLKIKDEPVEVPENKVLVPYNANGKRSGKIRMFLDLSEGQKIKLNPDHNCYGSKQPRLRHIYGKGAQDYEEVFQKPGPGEGVVGRYIKMLSAWELKIEGVTMLLGRWWLKAAERGQMDSIPVMNIQPVIGCEERDDVNGLAMGEEDPVLALALRMSMEEEKEKEREKGSAITGTISAPGKVLREAQLEEIENEQRKLEALLERTKISMARTERIAKSITDDTTEDNELYGANSNCVSENMTEAEQIQYVSSNMTEEEQIAFALQMSMEDRG